jgi:hypothetical protein
MKRLIAFMTTLALVALVGCSTVHMGTITANEGAKGTLKIGLQERDAEVVFDGKTYRGVWQELAASPEQLAQSSYPHRKHLTNIALDLTASDGSVLKCRGLTHAMQGELACAIDGKVQKVSLH